MRDRTWETAIIVLLTISLGLNVVALGRLKGLEIMQGQIVHLQGTLALVSRDLATANSRLESIEREAKWVTDITWDVDIDQVSRRGEPVPVSLIWALKEMPVGASVVLSYGPRGSSTWFETDEVDYTAGMFTAQLLLDSAEDWEVFVVVDDGHSKRTSDPLSIPLSSKLEPAFYAEVSRRDSRHEIEVMRRPPARFAWQVVDSITARFNHDGQEMEIILEPLDPTGESGREVWRAEVPESVTQVSITAHYADGYRDEAVLYLDSISEPLFPR